jgi:hypothetical protein
MDEGHERIIGIIAGILVVKQFREGEFRQNGISPRAQSVISNVVAWAERAMRHVDVVFGGRE